MATIENASIHDPLGLKRFALTESAYDLLNSIQGTYGRLSYAEVQKANADQELIKHWRTRSKEIARTYRSLSEKDFSAIEAFIKMATVEWHQITKLENERILVPAHVS